VATLMIAPSVDLRLITTRHIRSRRATCDHCCVSWARVARRRAAANFLMLNRVSRVS
jgi:hypothetical protein